MVMDFSLGRPQDKVVSQSYMKPRKPLKPRKLRKLIKGSSECGVRWIMRILGRRPFWRALAYFDPL